MLFSVFHVNSKCLSGWELVFVTVFTPGTNMTAPVRMNMQSNIIERYICSKRTFSVWIFGMAPDSPL